MVNIIEAANPIKTSILITAPNLFKKLLGSFLIILIIENTEPRIHETTNKNARISKPEFRLVKSILSISRIYWMVSIIIITINDIEKKKDK